MRNVFVAFALMALCAGCLDAFGPAEPNFALVPDECYGVIKEDTLFVTTDEFLPSGGPPLGSPFVIDTIIHRIYVQICPPN